MTTQVDPTSCEKTPGAIRAALERRPEWLSAFEQEFLGAAAEFDQAALDAVIEKWFPFACACVTPGYLAEVEDAVRRVQGEGAGGVIFRDAAGNAYDAENNSITASR